MLDRVAAIAPRGADEIWGGTFHSIGNRILRRHAEAIGFRSGFSIMDREDQEDMIEAFVARRGLPSGSPISRKRALGDLRRYAINCGEQIPESSRNDIRISCLSRPQIERVAIAYEGRKKAANSMDFDDLLAKTLELFATDESIAERYQRQFQHVLVDEYQDTNRLQAELVGRYLRPARKRDGRGG